MRITTYIGTLLFLGFLLSCSVYAKSVEEDDHLSSHATEVFCHKKIAIIGAGAGGSSAALYAREQFGPEVDIKVFEKASRVGGRVQDTIMEGIRMELGGAVYHKQNRLFASLVERYNLTVVDPVHAFPFENDTTLHSDQFAVWNGTDFLFQESSWTLITYLKALYRYGFKTPLAVSKLADDALTKFLKIYDYILPKSEEEKEEGDQHQQHQQQQSLPSSFDTVEEMLQALKLQALTRLSLEDYFLGQGTMKQPNGEEVQRHGLDPAFVREIAAGMLRVNYGQGLEMNALVGLIALIGSTDDLAAVKEGNHQVFVRALEEAQATVLTQHTVVRIARLPADAEKPSRVKYAVTYDPAESTGRKSPVVTEEFDAVIVATPLESANIEFSGWDTSSSSLKFDQSHGLQRRPYVRTFVTFVAGQLNLEYFGLPDSDQPQQIMTTDSPSQKFTSIFIKARLDKEGKKNLYKVFSKSALENSTLDELFKDRSTTIRTSFFAYPVLTVLPEGVPFPPFRLDANLFYVNSLESAFSCIETEMISAKNVVGLMKKSLVC